MQQSCCWKSQRTWKSFTQVHGMRLRLHLPTLAVSELSFFKVCSSSFFQFMVTTLTENKCSKYTKVIFVKLSCLYFKVWQFNDWFFKMGFSNSASLHLISTSSSEASNTQKIVNLVNSPFLLCFSLCVCLCVCVCLSGCLSVCLAVCLSVCLFFCLYVCLSVCLSQPLLFSFFLCETYLNHI